MRQKTTDALRDPLFFIKLTLCTLLAGFALLLGLDVFRYTVSSLTQTKVDKLDMEAISFAAGDTWEQQITIHWPYLTGIYLKVEPDAPDPAGQCLRAELVDAGSERILAEGEVLCGETGWVLLPLSGKFKSGMPCLLRLHFARGATCWQQVGTMIYTTSEPEGALVMIPRYQTSVFELNEKLVWLLALTALFLAVLSMGASTPRRRALRRAALLLGGAAVLFGAWLCNVWGCEYFGDFQADSAFLTRRSIIRACEGKPMAGYGLWMKDDEVYNSQFGLQGWVYYIVARILCRWVGEGKIVMLLEIGVVLALVLTVLAILLLVAKRYGRSMALCFGVVYCLSPWVIVFARNIYWLEFTWLLPMLVGLCWVCFGEEKWALPLCAAGMLVAVMVKSLCGYEYLSTILICGMLFPTAEWAALLVQGEYTAAKKRFGPLVVLGLAAVAGFCAALVLHAALRGNGNVGAGLVQIFREDALRRTLGGKLEDYRAVLNNGMNDGLGASLNAGIWQVLSSYFYFPEEGINPIREVLVGVPATAFPVLAALPILALVAGTSGKNTARDTVLYLVALASAVSWFVLGKSHSYIHTHMNYVLWYPAFVPVCLYLTLNGLRALLGRREEGMPREL